MIDLRFAVGTGNQFTITCEQDGLVGVSALEGVKCHPAKAVFARALRMFDLLRHLAGSEGGRGLTASDLVAEGGDDALGADALAAETLGLAPAEDLGLGPTTDGHLRTHLGGVVEAHGDSLAHGRLRNAGDHPLH